jgi:hypothetical protein
MRLLLVVLVAALALPTAAGAATFVPPRGKVYTGLSGSASASPFTEQVGSDVAVFGVFTKWYGQNEYAFRAAREAGARLMLHVSTQDGYGTRELITPRGIARGEGDRYDAFRGEPFVFGEWALWGAMTRAPCGASSPGWARTGACGCPSTTRAR